MSGSGARHVVILEAYPHLRGGAQRVNLTLALGLPAHGWACQVVAPGDGVAVDALRVAQIPVTLLPTGPSLQRYGQPRPSARMVVDLARWWTALVRHLRRVRAGGPAILLVNDQRGVILGAIAARLAGVPLVWHVHSAEQSTLLRRLGSAAAAAVVAPSRRTAARMPGHHVRVVPNGVPALPPAPPARPAAPPTLLTVGRLHPDKDLGMLLDAFARLRSSWPELTLSIVGDTQAGHERFADSLREQTRRLGIEAAVTFVEGADEPFARADERTVYVQSSARETFGLALAEAMGIGLAVVATDTDGATDLVRDGHTGLVVPTHDVDAMVAAVDRLFRDGQLVSTLGAAARLDVVSRFSPDAMVSAEAVVLDAVVESR